MEQAVTGTSQRRTPAKSRKKSPPDQEQEDLRLLREHIAALNRIGDELARARQAVKHEEAKMRSLALVAEPKDNQLTAFTTACNAWVEAKDLVDALTLCQQCATEQVQRDRAKCDCYYGADFRR
jgi:hypothetical protein